MKKILQSPFFNVTFLSIFWALQIFISKLAFNAGAQPFTFTIHSAIITFVILTAYLLPQKMHHIKKIPRHILFGLFLANLLAAGVGGVLSNAGIQLTTAINAGFLFQIDIALTILIAWFILRERLDTAKIATLSLIIFGSFLLMTNGQLITPHLGDLFIIFASACFATTTVLVRKILKHTTIHPDIATLVRAPAGFPIYILLFLILPFCPLPVQNIFAVDLLNFTHFPYVFASSGTIIAVYTFLNRTLKLASASYTAMMTSITPILVTLLAMIFLGESLAPLQFIGALLIILASFTTYILKVDKH